MVDIVDSITRSRMMAAVKSSNTKPELQIRQILHKRGFRFRLHEALLHKDLKVKTSHIYSNLSDNSGMWSA